MGLVSQRVNLCTREISDSYALLGFNTAMLRTADNLTFQ